MLSFSDYQDQAHTTAVYPQTLGVNGEEVPNLFYAGLGIAGEGGEVANKVKKVMRDDGGKLTEEARQAICKEIGGVLWYAAELATRMGVDLGEIAQTNLDKLASRQQRGTLHGSGDDR